MKPAELKRIILKELESEILNKQYTLTKENGAYLFWWHGQEEEVSEGLINSLLNGGAIVAIKRSYGLCYIPPRDMHLPCFKDDIVKKLCNSV